MEPSWDDLGAVLGHIGPSWGVLVPSWAVSEPSWGRLGAVLGPSWAVLGRLRSMDFRNCRNTKKTRKNDGKTTILASSGLLWGVLWDVLGGLLGVLGGFLGRLGAILGRLGPSLGALLGGVLGRLGPPEGILEQSWGPTTPFWSHAPLSDSTAPSGRWPAHSPMHRQRHNFHTHPWRGRRRSSK